MRKKYHIFSSKIFLFFSVVKNTIILHRHVNIMKSYKVDGTYLALISVIGSIIDLYFKTHMIV